jgi:hypothetical protein
MCCHLSTPHAGRVRQRLRVRQEPGPYRQGVQPRQGRLVQAVLLAALAALQARAARRQVVPQGLQRRRQLQPRQRPVRVPRGWVARGRAGRAAVHPASGLAMYSTSCQLPRIAPATAGWTGDDCTQPLKRPCTNRLSGHNDIPPSSHIDGNGRDKNVTASGWTPGRCAGGRAGWPGRSCWAAARHALQAAEAATRPARLGSTDLPGPMGPASTQVSATTCTAPAGATPAPSTGAGPTRPRTTRATWAGRWRVGRSPAVPAGCPGSQH